jgi:hypothetical protein
MATPRLRSGRWRERWRRRWRRGGRLGRRLVLFKASKTSFLEKRSKKLLLLGLGGAQAPRTQDQKFFGYFFSKK